jgi:hypothetical protein
MLLPCINRQVDRDYRCIMFLQYSIHIIYTFMQLMMHSIRTVDTYGLQPPIFSKPGRQYTSNCFWRTLGIVATVLFVLVETNERCASAIEIIDV